MKFISVDSSPAMSLDLSRYPEVMMDSVSRSSLTNSRSSSEAGPSSSHVDDLHNLLSAHFTEVPYFEKFPAHRIRQLPSLQTDPFTDHRRAALPILAQLKAEAIAYDKKYDALDTPLHKMNKKLDKIDVLYRMADLFSYSIANWLGENPRIGDFFSVAYQCVLSLNPPSWKLEKYQSSDLISDPGLFSTAIQELRTEGQKLRNILYQLSRWHADLPNDPDLKELVKHLTGLLNGYEHEILILEQADTTKRIQLLRPNALIYSPILGSATLPQDVARQLISLSFTGRTIKLNADGDHPVISINGIHYKASTTFPSFCSKILKIGHEFAASTFLNLCSPSHMIATPVSWLRVTGVQYLDLEELRYLFDAAFQKLAVAGLKSVEVFGAVYSDVTSLRKRFEELRKIERQYEQDSNQRRDYTGLADPIYRELPHKRNMASIFVQASYTSGYQPEGDPAQLPPSCTLKAFLEMIDVIPRLITRLKPTEFSQLWENLSPNQESLSWAELMDRLFDLAEGCENGKLFFGYLIKNQYDLHPVISDHERRDLIQIFRDFPFLIPPGPWDSLTLRSLLTTLSACRLTKQYFPDTPCSELTQALNHLWDQLDKESFDALFIGSLLCNPEDGKPDNYVVRAGFSEDSHIIFRIDAVDNDHSFERTFVELTNTRYIPHTKCVLFAFPDDLLELPISEKVRNHFLRRSPIEILMDWITKVDRFESEFNDYGIDKDLENSIWREIGHTSDIRFDPYKDQTDLPLHLPKTTLLGLYFRMEKIRALLQKGEDDAAHWVSLNSLFRELHPNLFSIYHSLKAERSLPPTAVVHQLYDWRDGLFSIPVPEIDLSLEEFNEVLQESEIIDSSIRTSFADQLLVLALYITNKVVLSYLKMRANPLSFFTQEYERNFNGLSKLNMEVSLESRRGNAIMLNEVILPFVVQEIPKILSGKQPLHDFAPTGLSSSIRQMPREILEPLIQQFWFALETGERGTLVTLFRVGVSCNIRHVGGNTPLLHVVKSFLGPSFSMISLLCDQPDLQIDALDEESTPALYYLIRDYDHTVPIQALLSLFIRRNANFNWIHPIHRLSPLDLLIQRGEIELADWVCHQTNAGYTLSSIAEITRMENSPLKSILIERSPFLALALALETLPKTRNAPSLSFIRKGKVVTTPLEGSKVQVTPLNIDLDSFSFALLTEQIAPHLTHPLKLGLSSSGESRWVSLELPRTDSALESLFPVFSDTFALSHLDPVGTQIITLIAACLLPHISPANVTLQLDRMNIDSHQFSPNVATIQSSQKPCRCVLFLLPQFFEPLQEEAFSLFRHLDIKLCLTAWIHSMKRLIKESAKLSSGKPDLPRLLFPFFNQSAVKKITQRFALLKQALGRAEATQHPSSYDILFRIDPTCTARHLMAYHRGNTVADRWVALQQLLEDSTDTDDPPQDPLVSTKRPLLKQVEKILGQKKSLPSQPNFVDFSADTFIDDQFCREFKKNLPLGQSIKRITKNKSGGLTLLWPAPGDFTTWKDLVGLKLDRCSDLTAFRPDGSLPSLEFLSLSHCVDLSKLQLRAPLLSAINVIGCNSLRAIGMIKQNKWLTLTNTRRIEKQYVELGPIYHLAPELARQDVSELHPSYLLLLLACAQQKSPVAFVNFAKSKHVDPSTLWTLLRRNGSLRMLQIRNTDPEIKFLKGLHSTGTLKAVSLCNCNLGTLSIRVVCNALIRNSTVHAVDLSFNWIHPIDIIPVIRLVEKNPNILYVKCFPTLAPNPPTCAQLAVLENALQENRNRWEGPFPEWGSDWTNEDQRFNLGLFRFARPKPLKAWIKELSINFSQRKELNDMDLHLKQSIKDCEDEIEINLDQQDFEGFKDISDQIKLAQRYIEGTGVEKNIPEAKRLLRDPSERSVDALVLLGHALLYHPENKEERKEGLEMLERAARVDQAEAHFQLGFFHLNIGKGYEQAIPFLRRGKTLGNFKAEIELARAEGIFSENREEIRQALLCLRELAKGGSHYYARELLKICLYRKRYLAREDKTEELALELVQKAKGEGCEKSETLLRFISLLNTLFSDTTLSQLQVLYLNSSAFYSDLNVNYLVALGYSERNQHENVIFFARRAVEEGIKEAVNLLAFRLFKEEYGLLRIDEAIQTYEEAIGESLLDSVDQAYPDLMKLHTIKVTENNLNWLGNLAGLYQAQKKHLERAFALFYLSALSNSIDATFGVGACYELGWGIGKDQEAADEWYQKALDLGFRESLEKGNLFYDIPEKRRIAYHVAKIDLKEKGLADPSSDGSEDL